MSQLEIEVIPLDKGREFQFVIIKNGKKNVTLFTQDQMLSLGNMISDIRDDILTDDSQHVINYSIEIISDTDTPIRKKIEKVECDCTYGCPKCKQGITK